MLLLISDGRASDTSGEEDSDEDEQNGDVEVSYNV